MVHFDIPNVGHVLVFRRGRDLDDHMPERHRHIRWRYVVLDTDARTVLAEGGDLSTPAEAGPDVAVVALMGLLEHKSLIRGDKQLPDYLTAWSSYDFESDDNERGYADSMNWFRRDGVTHYRSTPYTESHTGHVWTELQEVAECMRDYVERGWITPTFDGVVWKLYPNDSDTPTHEAVVGMWGGVRIKKMR